MKAASLPNLNRETTSFPNFFTLYQDVDHDDDMTINDRPNIDHGDDTEASETSPFNDILSLSLSLSPLVSSNEIRFLAAPRSVRMFRCESEHTTSSVGSNQFSGESGARSEGTSPAQLWRDRNNHPDFPERELLRGFSMREEKSINPELWQACSGPLVNLPAAGTHVVYFPQGHSEQADPDTDEVYAQMTLQPVPSFDNDALLRSDLSMKINKPQTEFFCKTLTASDANTHGGFSIPRRAAEKIFPPLDFTLQPPAQELVARDLHDNLWTFRHIYRGQPKRHLLTTGWSLFVSGKRLCAGDSVLFIRDEKQQLLLSRDEKQQLLLGIRRANRQPTNLSSSVLSSDSMHIGTLAAAAHAAANNSPFTVFYIPRYMGTITGITDLDPAGWKDSQWRNLQVVWDESTPEGRRNRVSAWEIEPVTSPSFIFPTPPSQEGLNK